MDEFTDRLERHKTEGMAEEQATIAKDIRRRGKNKNAAQNCRKRANERLETLKDDVSEAKKRRRTIEVDIEKLKNILDKEEKRNEFLQSLILKATGRDGRDGRIFIIEDDFENNTIKFREKHQERSDRFEYQSAPPPNRTVINPINNPIINPINNPIKPRALHTSPVSLLKVPPNFPYQASIPSLRPELGYDVTIYQVRPVPDIISRYGGCAPTPSFHHLPNVYQHQDYPLRNHASLRHGFKESHPLSQLSRDSLSPDIKQEMPEEDLSKG